MRKFLATATAMLTFIPLVVATLYLAGVISEQAYLVSVGLRESQFPISFERAVLGGSTSFLLEEGVSLGYLALAITCVGGLCSTAGQFLRQPRKRNVKYSSDIAHAPSRLEGLGDRLINIAIVIIAIIGSMLTTIIIANRAGESAASRFKERAGKGQLPRVELHMRGAATRITATTIDCTDTQCAYWLGDRSLVLNLSDIDRAFAWPARAR